MVGLPSIEYRGAYIRKVPGGGGRPEPGPAVDLGQSYDSFDLILFRYQASWLGAPGALERAGIVFYALVFALPVAGFTAVLTRWRE